MALGTAMPQMEPNDRMKVQVAVAVATSETGRLASRGGIMVLKTIPFPSPKSNWNPIQAPMLEFSSRTARLPHPAAINAKPRKWKMRYFPLIVIKTPEIAAAGAMVVAMGKICTPERVGEDPRTAWK